MKKLLFLLLFWTTFVHAQNLVPNGSFEQVNQLNCQFSADSSYFSNAMGWWSPTFATPDLYSNNCTPYFGACKAYDGGNFAGAHEYQPGGYREYIQCRLVTPLVTGSWYKLTMYAALASSSSFADNLQVLLSNKGDSLNYPQIDFGIINDSSWEELTSYFSPTDSFSLLTIGNFNFLQLDSLTGSPYKYAYYYLDDISIVPVNNLPTGVNNTFKVSKNLEGVVKLYDLLGRQITSPPQHGVYLVVQNNKVQKRFNP